MGESGLAVDPHPPTFRPSARRVLCWTLRTMVQTFLECLELKTACLYMCLSDACAQLMHDSDGHPAEHQLQSVTFKCGALGF